MILGLCLILMAPAQPIAKQRTVQASVQQVWEAWTTVEGVKSFFAPEAQIGTEVGEPYEIYFVPTAEPGQRGAEGMRIMILDAPNYLAFTWNFPPSLPSIRHQQTMVAIRLMPGGEGQCRVSLEQWGFGEGEDWEKGRAYFDKAWEYVLDNLVKRFDSGPIQW